MHTRLGASKEHEMKQILNRWSGTQWAELFILIAVGAGVVEAMQFMGGM